MKPAYIGYVPKPGTKEPGVYMYEHLATGKVYIGSTVNGYGRFIQHTTALERGAHANRNFQRVFNQEPVFSVEFIKLHENKKPDEVLLAVRKLEQQLIDSFPDKTKLLNIAKDVFACGTAISPTKETREKLSIAMKNRVVSEETRKKQSLALMGHSCSPETRAAISVAKTGRKQSPDHAAKSKAAALVRAKPVSINGKHYQSIKDASIGTGMSISGVKKRIKSRNPSFKDWEFK